MPPRKNPLNPEPLGPAHIYWPNGAPVRRAPRSGIYAIRHRQETFYRQEEQISQNLLEK